VLPRTEGIGTQPAPESSAADLSDDALRRWGNSQARALLRPRCWGEKRTGRPPRGCSSRPGRRARASRLLTRCRGVSKREAMISLGRPCAARSTIFALTTSRYGDVYFRARNSSSFRSCGVRMMRNGLDRGKTCPSRGKPSWFMPLSNGYQTSSYL